MEDKTSHYRKACRSPATLRAYASDFRDFEDWCATSGLSALPATGESVAAYLADRAGTLKPGTLERRVAAITYAHRRANLPFDHHDSAVTDVLNGIRRTHGVAPTQKTPLTTEEIREIAAVLPDTVAGRRDRAILLLGFAAALRRSEVAALTLEGLSFSRDGLTLKLGRAKEDQQGKGQLKGVPYGASPETCPVRAVKTWLLAARLGGGPLFRRVGRDGSVSSDGLSGAAVAAIVKRAVAIAGRRAGWTDPMIADRVARVAGHSLRSGFVSSAAARGLSEWQIMKQTGHRRPDTVRRYIRLGGVFVHNAAGRVGL